MLLATEFDLLFHEPALLALCRAAAVRVMSATATVAGTTVAVSGATFTTGSPFVSVGMAAYFPDSTVSAGVVALLSATQLAVSQPSPGLTEDTGPWIAPGISGSATVEVYAFPQLRVATDQVLAALDVDVAEIVAPDVLRRACCHAALAAIFRTMAAFDRTTYTAGTGYLSVFTPNDRWDKLADAHDAAYQLSLRAAKVAVDRDADGTTDFTASVAQPRVRRG